MLVSVIFLAVNWLAQPGSFKLSILHQGDEDSGGQGLRLAVDCGSVLQPVATPDNSKALAYLQGRLGLVLAADNPGLFPHQLQEVRLAAARLLSRDQVAEASANPFWLGLLPPPVEEEHEARLARAGIEMNLVLKGGTDTKIVR